MDKTTTKPRAKLPWALDGDHWTAPRSAGGLWTVYPVAATIDKKPARAWKVASDAEPAGGPEFPTVAEARDACEARDAEDAATTPPEPAK